MPAERPLEFGQWETLTQSNFYRSEVNPLGQWVKGAVLDVAANYGRFSVMSRDSVSVDVEPRFLQRGLQLGNITRAVRGSALLLPFRDSTFQTVLAMGIVDHIPWLEIPRFLEELSRVTKDRGTLVIQVTSPYSLLAMASVRYYGPYNHPYSPFLLVRQLRARGWKPVAAFSSGLAGLLGVMTWTIPGFLPWAVHISVIFKRGLH